jgi:hypothetical protein
MTFFEFLFIVAITAALVIAGVVLACHRLKGSLRIRSGKPATRRQLLAKILLSDKLRQALPKALGGGGGGPIEPF